MSLLQFDRPYDAKAEDIAISTLIFCFIFVCDANFGPIWRDIVLFVIEIQTRGAIDQHTRAFLIGRRKGGRSFDAR
jgi:hypothetical protein